MKLREYDLLTRLIRTRSLLIASVCYAVGCVFAHVLRFTAIAYLIAFALCVIAVLPKHRFRLAFVMLCVVCVGTANFAWQWSSAPTVTPQKDAFLSGQVCERPTANVSGDRLVILLDHVELNGLPQRGRLRLYLRNEEDPSALFAAIPSVGQRVECESTHIRRGSHATNPGQFDFSNYLRLNNISGYATGKLEVTKYGGILPDWGNLSARIRSAISSRIDRLFPARADIAKAFLIGDRSEISAEDRDSFSTAGIAHLLAISGMHISLLSYAIMWLLNLRLPRKVSFLITLGLLFIYGLLLGFPASLFRAFAMFAVSGIGSILGRRTDPLTSLAFSMLLYLIWQPIQILSTGFALSYGATAGIILLYEPITALLHADGFLNRRANSIRHPLLYRVARWIVELLIVSLSAQIAILPIVVYTYGAQSILSFVTGLFAIPIAMIAYLLAIPAVILRSSIFAAVSDRLFESLARIARFASGIPAASIRIARFPVLLVFAYIIVCLIASPLSKVSIKIRRFLPLFVIPAILIANLCSWISTMGTGVLFMDSGQSDCAVIHSAGNIYLVDTGESGSPVYDYLTMINRNVKGIFITHPHADHTGGIEKILTFCTPEKIYITDHWNAYDVDQNVLTALEACRSSGSEIIYVAAGDKILLSREAEISVLAPDKTKQPGSPNEDSMILRMSCGEASVLFTGDSDGKDIESIVLDSDILKVPHHGSADAVTETLLENISPSACVISVGENNYGHPTENALDLIQLSGARLYRTDLCGSIDCTLRPDGSITISTTLKQEAAP